jgi:hypothetical protein
MPINCSNQNEYALSHRGVNRLAHDITEPPRVLKFTFPGDGGASLAYF